MIDQMRLERIVKIVREKAFKGMGDFAVREVATALLEAVDPTPGYIKQVRRMRAEDPDISDFDRGKIAAYGYVLQQVFGDDDE